MKPGRNDSCPCGSGKKYKHCCERKVEARPAVSLPTLAEFNQLIALFNAGRFVEVESQTRSLIEQFPESAVAWKLLGACLHRQGKGQDALPALLKATKLLPNDAEAHFNLGVTQESLKQPNEAVASYRRSLILKPDSAATHNNLANALRDLGQLDDAVASCRRALEIKPDYAGAYHNLSNALRDLGQQDNAIASSRHALEINPNFAEAHYSLSLALNELGQFKDAEANCRRALAINPDYSEAHNILGLILHTLGRYYDAAMSCRRAIALMPNSDDAHNNFGNALYELGQINDAIASYRRALEINPNFAAAHSNLLFCLNHCETKDTQSLYAEHYRFGEQFEAPLRAYWQPHSNTREPERCLQIGFVSGDLRNHAVAHFLEPVLAHLAQYPQLSLHAYYNHTVEDSGSRRLKGYFAHWNSIPGLSDAALAQKIRADGIDILYDLSGHTGKNRLLTFALKPAPVQVSWMGYPGTTGLSAMDYYQSDRFLFPNGQFEDQFTEKIVCLPASSAFLPSQNAPPVNVLPALSNGYMTFGSFNRSSKITRSVVALWAQLLRALPDSRMLLGAMPQNGQYQTLIEWFAQEGITQDRLVFHVRSDMDRYLNLHHQVDICLDTFPYNGGTTTFHALWMGIPTLTLAGCTLAGWAGVSILGHVGLEAFAGQDAADFVQKGVFWANHLTELAKIRAELRERFAKSARGQPEVVAIGMESALRIMWQRWCAGLPAEPLEVSLHEVNNMMKRSTNTGVLE